MASEPVTAAVLIGLGSAAVVSVGRIIERWIEKRRQAENLNLVLQAYRVSEEAGAVLAETAKRHAEVEYQLADPAGGLLQI